MHCAQCGWPREEARIVSTHPTSQGWVRYRECMCGAVTIELVTLADRGATHAEPVR